MVRDELDDGVRIAQLLASEVDADEARLTALAVTDADPDVSPTADGTLAYRIRIEEDLGGGTLGEDRDEETAGGDSGREAEPLADVYVHPDRVRVEFRPAPAVAADAARDEGLRVRPAATRPPRTIVFVENGAQVKWVLPVFEAVLDESRRQ